MSLDNKIVLVTGGSGLIGRELVKDINCCGGRAINADVAVETDLKNGTLFMDVTKDSSIHDGLKMIVDEYGHIDGLVNNAYPRTQDWGDKFEDIDPASWRVNIDMQLNSYFVCSQLVLKIMDNQKSGVSSILHPYMALWGMILHCMKIMVGHLQQHIRLSRVESLILLDILHPIMEKVV